MERNKPDKVRWRFGVRKAVFMYFCCFFSHADSYNLDVDHSIPISGPSGSLFGYSVLLHKHRQQTWLLVGAPVANSSFDQSIRNPGAIYKCKITERTECEQMQIGIRSNQSCGKTCFAEMDNQWLGVSLSRQPSDGLMLACGHRWKNVFYSKKDNQHKLPHGVCYKVEADLIQSTRLIPCYRDHQRKFGEDYGSCQAGMSNFLTEDLIVMGAPGTSYWTGSVLVYNTSSNMLSAYVDDGTTVVYGSYLGYSVSAGQFSHPGNTEVVGGAPQHGQTGKAYIFQVQSTILKIIFEAKGHKLGSYFGATVCAVDLNSDGLSDLLVGAPMYSTVREEGRVHVYINQGAANMKEEEFQLVGSDSYAARFGETITNLGDIDDDGYPDVAVAAPQEEDLRGAVYIYNGRKSSIAQSFSQRITGAVLGNAFMMFGQSVSGGIDVDSNGYPDVAVGALLSDSAVILRTRPVVIVEAFMLLPPSVNRSEPLCSDSGQPAICINASLCVRVRGRRLSGHIGLLYNLTVDVRRKEGFPPRFSFTGNGTSNTTTGRIKAKHEQLTCAAHQVYMRKDVRDIFTPIYFEATYELGEHNVIRSKNFPPLKPILQQREGRSNTVLNKTEFARHCAWPNCSSNLQLSARLVLPQTHRNLSYFALGNGKTIMLNVTLVNAGDDAFLPVIHLRYPSNLYFIKVLNAEERHVTCRAAEEENVPVGMDCSVGSLYMSSMDKLKMSFLMDVNHSSNAGDLNMTVSARCDNYEKEDFLHDNFAQLTLPLRHGIGLNVHGFVSPTAFIFGEHDDSACYTERFNYTFKVLNAGPSRALDAKVEIDIPNSLVPHPYRLHNIVEIQSSMGWCYPPDSAREPSGDCSVPKPRFIEDLVFFFSKTLTRRMYCMKEDGECLHVVCKLGDLDIGKEATIHMEVELNPAVLQVSPGRQGIMVIESSAIAMPREDPYNLYIQENPFTTVDLEGHFNQKPTKGVEVFVTAVSLGLGVLILALVIYCLWMVGFFKRGYKMKEEAHRDSWDYVPKNESLS
ncbi:integrin alpha-4-like [Conger conger]|uniref:integrin alpha-4-like n=1 Tax=Conger conger TaxID=82655 RepID=UPI002A59CBEF|nr:integrin alpha-4-like [Conger conger]